MKYEINVLRMVGSNLAMTQHIAENFKQVSENMVSDGWTLHSYDSCMSETEKEQPTIIITTVWQK